MTETQKDLETAFNILSLIPVAGENVDRMMVVREHLRRAYRLAENRESEQAAACARAAEAVASAAREAAENG